MTAAAPRLGILATAALVVAAALWDARLGLLGAVWAAGWIVNGFLAQAGGAHTPRTDTARLRGCLQLGCAKRVDAFREDRIVVAP